MKSEPEKSPARLSGDSSKGESQGKTMAPPSFQLQASASTKQAAEKNEASSEHEGGQSTLEGGNGAHVVTNTPTGGLVSRSGTPIVVSYSVPLVKSNIQASASETLIFGVVASDGSGSTDAFETRYSLTGAGEFDSAGSGLTQATRPGLQSRNVNVVTGSRFTTGTITVTAVLRNTTQNRDEVTITWTVIPRSATTPTSLTKISGPAATAWATAPASYGYQAGPDVGGDGRADYMGQTVLERFGAVTPLGFTMDDITDAWKAANPTANTPERVARQIWDSGGNGTFVFDAQDRIYDRHSGFGATAPFKPTAFDDADGVGYRLPQEYVVGSTVIGRCNIDRRQTTANGTQIRKSDPV